MSSRNCNTRQSIFLVEKDTRMHTFRGIQAGIEEADACNKQENNKPDAKKKVRLYEGEKEKKQAYYVRASGLYTNNHAPATAFRREHRASRLCKKHGKSTVSPKPPHWFDGSIFPTAKKCHLLTHQPESHSCFRGP